MTRHVSVRALVLAVAAVVAAVAVIETANAVPLRGAVVRHGKSGSLLQLTDADVSGHRAGGRVHSRTTAAGRTEALTHARTHNRARDASRLRSDSGWTGWDPEHPIKSLQPPWVKMEDVGDFDLPSPPAHMHPPPPPPSFWSGMVHGDSTQGGGMEEGFGGLYGFEEDRYLPPPPKAPPHVPPPIPPPPPKGPEANEAFVEKDGHTIRSAAAPTTEFVNPFDPNSPITHAPADAAAAAAAANDADPARRALISRLTRYKPLFGHLNDDLPANNRLWTPPPDARTAGSGRQPFAPPAAPAAGAGAGAGAVDESRFVPPHLLPGAPAATEPAPQLVPTKPTSLATVRRFDPTLKPAK